MIYFGYSLGYILVIV